MVEQKIVSNELENIDEPKRKREAQKQLAFLKLLMKDEEEKQSQIMPKFNVSCPQKNPFHRNTRPISYQKYEREQTFKESKAPREGFLPDVKTDVRTLKSASRERMRSMTELEKIYGSK